MPKALFDTRIPPLKKILLANQGSLGDVFLSTHLIPALKASHSGCSISFLVSGKGFFAAKGCPGVDEIHRLDYWLDGGGSSFHKAVRFFQFHLWKKPKLLQELTLCEYDCAINLYPFLSDTIPLFLKARIPVRIAFDALGYRQLMTHAIPWECGHYLTYHYQRLLEESGLCPDRRSFFSPWLARPPSPARGPVGDYFLFHMGSSSATKELPPAFWRGLLGAFEEAGHRVYFTGRGKREHQQIEAAVSREEQNLCDCLLWDEWIDVIGRAQGVVGVDSAIVHIAAAFSKPFALFYQNQWDIPLWRPPSWNGIAFTPKGSEPLACQEGQLIVVDTYDSQAIAAILLPHFATISGSGKKMTSGASEAQPDQSVSDSNEEVIVKLWPTREN